MTEFEPRLSAAVNCATTTVLYKTFLRKSLQLLCGFYVLNKFYNLGPLRIVASRRLNFRARQIPESTS